MKRLFRRKKKSASEAGSIGSGLSGSAYNVSPKKDLGKLHRAAFEGDLTKLKTLLKRADVNQLDKENRTPLHLACANGKYDAVWMLSEHPYINLNLCDNERKSALMKCVQCEHQTCLKILLDKNADVSLSDENGNTALHIAASIPNSDICYLLSDYKADPKARNKDGATALHIASSLGSDEIVKLLLGTGVDIDDIDDNSKTPLMHAAHKGHLTTVKLLLSKNANSALRDINGWTADDYASMDGFHPISHIITEHNTKRGVMSPASGHSTISRTPQTSPQKLGPQANIGLGGPALDTGDSETDDSFSADKASEQKDSWASTSSEEEEPKYATVLKKADRGKPKINVMKALDWKKNSSQTAAEKTSQSPSKATASLFFTASAREQVKKREELEDGECDDEFEESEPRKRYESKSARGERVSPAKPPLPVPQGTALDSPQTKRVAEDEDSPWDSSDDGGGLEPQPTSPDNKISDQLPRTKPSQHSTQQLGSETKRKDLHGEKKKDKKIVAHSAKASDFPLAPAVVVQKHTADESDSWDDSFSEKEGSAKKDGKGFNFMNKSSDLKFDDETDSEADAMKPSSLENKPGLPVARARADSDESSSWNSDKIAKEAPASQLNISSPRAAEGVQHPGSLKPASTSEREQSKGLGIVYGAQLSGEGVSTESEMESESSWEHENRLKRTRASNNKLDRDKELVKSKEERKEEGGPSKTREVEGKRLGEESKTRAVEKKGLEAALLEEEKRKRKVEKEQRRREEEEKERLEQENRKRGLEELEKMNKMNEELEKKNAELRRKAQEEERRKWEQGEKLRVDAAKTTSMNESLRAALERAVDVTSESGDSDVDQRARSIAKVDQIKADVIADSMSGTRHNRPALGDAVEVGRGNNVVDLDTLTEETDEDLSLRDEQQPFERAHAASPLLDSLKLVEERQDLSLRLAREQDTSAVAQERLKTMRRENEQLKMKERSLVERRKEWELERVGMNAEKRKAGFEVKNLEEGLETVNLKLAKQEERCRRTEEQLHAEREERKRQEVFVRDLETDLKNLNAAKKRFELECAELRKKLAIEEQSKNLAKTISEGDIRLRATLQHEIAKDSRGESLERVMNEKNQELIKVRAERDRYEDACSRYKAELAKLRSRDPSDHRGNLIQLNQELNEKLDEKEIELRESEEALQLTALQTVQFKQAYENLTRQLENEKRERESVVRDLQLLGAQQEQWKRQAEDSRSSLLREQERLRKLENSQERMKEKEEDLQGKLFASETKAGHLENDLRMAQYSDKHRVEEISARESEYGKLQDASRESEKNVLKLQKKMAEQSGQIEALKIELRQRENECIETRREKEDIRSRNAVSVDVQQEKFNAKITALQREHENERVAFETHNVQLAQQVEHWKSEVGRIEREKTLREDELALAQHDRIEAHKQLGYADAFSKSASEEQKHLMEENTKVKEDSIRLQSQVSLLEQKLGEKLSAVADLQREVDGFRQNAANANRTIDSLSGSQRLAESGRAKFEQRLKDVELENIRLSSELESAKSWKTRLQKSREEDAHQKATLEERISKLECDKVIAEEKLAKEVENAKILHSEADAHKSMLEAEVKSRSELDAELSKLGRELEEERARAESARSKLTSALEDRKTIKTKYERLKRKADADGGTDYRSDAYGARRKATEAESESDSRTSTTRRGDGTSRRNATIAKLEDEVARLTRQLKEKKRLRFTEERAHSSANSNEIERLQRDNDRLNSELGQFRARTGGNYVDRSQLEAVRQEERTKAQAAIAPTLDQVNAFLKSQQAAQDFRDQLMLQREESTAVQAATRIASLEEELRHLRRRREDRPYATLHRQGAELSQLYENARMKNEILEQQLARANSKAEEYKGNWMKERKKFQTFFSGTLGGGLVPESGDVSNLPLSNGFAAYPGSKHGGGPPLPLGGAWFSTPKRELSETPLLSQLRDKLDASIAQHLGGPRVTQPPRHAHNGYASPAASSAGSPRSTDWSPQQRAIVTSDPGHKQSQNEYMSFLLT